MKLLLLVFNLWSVCVVADFRKGDATISRVVKLLQEIMEETKADGDAERVLFSKHKCYCETNKASKTTSVATLTKQISSLENEIDGVQSQNAALSIQSNQLERDLADNVKARTEASTVREEEETAFNATELESVTAIGQIEQAIVELASVGADQTKAIGADHRQFMANNGAGFLALKSILKRVFSAVSSDATLKQANRIASFLQQTPFTGTYTSQAGEVVGILKDMKVTFESNLATARSEESAATEAFTNFIKRKVQEHEILAQQQVDVQEQLGQNDGQLSAKRIQLTAARTNRQDDEDFLTSLSEACAAKAKEYTERTAMRRNEETALAEAIAILNTDAAFETFQSTANPSFLQQRSIRLHKQIPSTEKAKRRERAQTLLRQGGGSHSLALMSIAGLLAANNPFSVVLNEIKKMLVLIAKEGGEDEQKLAWCDSERQTNGANLQTKKTEISDLDAAITALENQIENPEDGLRKQVTMTETELSVSAQNQQVESTNRKADTAQYKKAVKNLVEEQRLVTSALSVLQNYYAKILKVEEGVSSLLQDEPAPPATWEAAYNGNKKGTDAIGMLKFILQNSKTEELEAHSAEQSAQETYEQDMAAFQLEDKRLGNVLATLKETLASKEQELLERKSDLKATEGEKTSIEDYLTKIKPGCDFISSQFTFRASSRQEEKEALEKASALLKDSPAYLTAEADAHNEALGDCLSSCSSEDTAVCKACLAKVTVPAYCAGHPETEGC
jgi:hypothetical protein